MSLTQILTTLAPLAGAFLAGGIGAYYKYMSGRPKSEAEAQKIRAEVEVTFADGWHGLYERVERRCEELERRQAANENEITRLREVIRDQGEKSRETLKTKDDEIYLLQAKNRDLERRVHDLEVELEKYRQVGG